MRERSERGWKEGREQGREAAWKGGGRKLQAINQLIPGKVYQQLTDPFHHQT